MAWPAGASLPSVTMQERLLAASITAAASMCMNGMFNFRNWTNNFEDTDFKSPVSQPKKIEGRCLGTLSPSAARPGLTTGF